MTQKAGPSTCRKVAVVLGWSLLCAVLGTSTSRSATNALEPREAQFVFLIDDSRSMREEVRGSGRSDPDRLAVFAVRALLGVLNDRDWVSVVRLNGPVDEENPPPLAPLDRPHRARIDRVLELTGKLADYGGDYTPCRSALKKAFDLLGGVDRPDVSQVGIFLSDGECTRQGEGRVMDLLDRLRSYREDRFQFYLLRFQGTQPSPELERLAEATGGSAIQVQRGDPTRILNTFAQALSRSQGYESQILTPARADLSAHRGARRVRLLAVAPGEGPGLQLTVTDLQGHPVAVDPLAAGQHQYSPDGREYRFASARYDPTGEPVRVEVRGAGTDWEVVALPEYRLAAELAIRRGRCGEEGEEVESVIGAGSDLCAVIRLLNDRGRVVGQDITAGRLQGVIEQTPPGGEPHRITANPDREGEASFRLDLSALAEGHHTIRAEVRLTPPDEDRPRVLSAGERTLQAIDRAIQPQPPRVDLGDVHPGFGRSAMVGLAGNFPETQVRLELEEPERLPGCLTLRFADRPLGEAVRILPGQTYPLRLEVADECGQQGVYPVDTHLKILMDELPEVGTVSMPLSWRLDNTVRKADALSFELEAGSSGEGAVTVPAGEGALAPDAATLRYDAAFDPVRAEGAEPTENLRIGFVDPHGEVRMLLHDDGEPVRQGQVAITADQPLRVRVEALPCCGTGRYSSRLRLRSVGGGTPVEVPIEVTVAGSWWTCYRSWVIAALLGLLAFLLMFYLISIFTHCRLLSRKQLVTRLVPLHWPRYGGAPRPASDRGGDREEVEDMVGAGMRWHRRLLAWLKANPLIIGLPRQRYRETAELNLSSSLEFSSVDLQGERDVVGRLQSSPELDPGDEGRLFARAGSGVNFFAVRGPRGAIGELTPEGWYGKRDGYTVEQLAKGQRLIHKVSGTERKEGHVGGWQLG